MSSLGLEDSKILGNLVGSLRGLLRAFSGLSRGLLGGSWASGLVGPIWTSVVLCGLNVSNSFAFFSLPAVWLCTFHSARFALCTFLSACFALYTFYSVCFAWCTFRSVCYALCTFQSAWCGLCTFHSACCGAVHFSLCLLWDCALFILPAVWLCSLRSLPCVLFCSACYVAVRFQKSPNGLKMKTWAYLCFLPRACSKSNASFRAHTSAAVCWA